MITLVLCASLFNQLEATVWFYPHPWLPINHPSATNFLSLQVNTNVLLKTNGELPPPTPYLYENPNWTISKMSLQELWVLRKVHHLVLNVMHPMGGQNPVCIGCCRAKIGWRPLILQDSQWTQKANSGFLMSLVKIPQRTFYMLVRLLPTLETSTNWEIVYIYRQVQIEKLKFNQFATNSVFNFSNELPP